MLEGNGDFMISVRLIRYFCNFVPQVALIAFALTFISISHVKASEYTIGVYYYPGWSPGIKGPSLPDPWKPIYAYPEKKPYLGWYDDSRVKTLEQQLKWMHQYGIDFVAFDWYWENGRPATESSVGAYLKAPSKSKVKYALLWANHGKIPNARKQWEDMIDYWLVQHLKNPEYLQIEGQPVVFIFSGDDLRDNARNDGTNTQTLLNIAQDKARAKGLKGIYFVFSTPATEYWVKAFAIESNFSALSAYNYHFGITHTFVGGKYKETILPASHSYKELDEGYRMQWQWILENSKLPYFIPMTSGWDKRPWGGSKDPLHDNSMSTPDEFEAHLKSAKSMMDSYPKKTKRIGLICCWNEYGEGSYIEPTKKHGFSYLERLKAVFGGGN